MKLKTGYLYHVKDEFFSDMSDMGLMFNKENKNFRPNYYAFQDVNNPDIFWMIPLSSKVDKYKLIIQSKMKKYGKCSNVVIGILSNRESVFLIQNAFPITKNYIHHQHVSLDGKEIKVNSKLEEEINKNLIELIKLKKVNMNLFYTDVDGIYTRLINQIELNNDKVSIVEKIEKIQNKQSQDLNKVEKQFNLKNDLEK